MLNKVMTGHEIASGNINYDGKVLKLVELIGLMDNFELRLYRDAIIPPTRCVIWQQVKLGSRGENR